MKITINVLVTNWKFIWSIIIAIILEALNFIITNNMLPKATLWIALAIAILTAIGNAIAGTVTLIRYNRLKQTCKIQGIHVQ